MADDVYRQALDAVATTIQGLALTGFRADEVRVRRRPESGEFKHPGISVFWDQEREGNGSNERDDIGYPCVIDIATGSDRGDDERINAIAAARRSIRRAFNHTRTPIASIAIVGVCPTVCLVSYESIDLSKFWQENWNDSRLVVWCWFRESR